MTASSSFMRPGTPSARRGWSQQLGRFVLERDLAGLQHVAALRDAERVVRVLLHQQDRGALAVDLGDRLVDPLDEDRRDSHRGLVEQQQLRVGHQGAADREHLLLAAGHRSALLALALLQAREQRRRRAPCPCRCPSRPCAGRRRGRGSRARVMRGNTWRPSGDWEMPICDDLLRRHLADLRAVELDRALARRREARDRAQRRGLAGAVRADQRDDLALLDRRARCP